MALCITISSTNKPRYEEGAPYLLLKYGHYLWLSPHLEVIQRSTSKLIDPYDTVSFGGDELGILEKEINGAVHTAEMIPNTITLNIGPQINPDGSKIDLIRVVTKAELKEMLSNFLGLIAQAKAKNKFILCMGD